MTSRISRVLFLFGIALSLLAPPLVAGGLPNCTPSIVITEVLDTVVEYPEIHAAPAVERQFTVVRPELLPPRSGQMQVNRRDADTTALEERAPLAPDPVFDSTTSDDTGFALPPNPAAAVGTTHIVDATNTVLSIIEKDGDVICRGSLSTFFSALTPLSDLSHPRVLYDHYYDRFVVIAMDNTDDGQAFLGTDSSRMFVAVSDDGNPVGTWRLVQIATLLPSYDPDGGGPADPAPHWATLPKLGMEQRQLFMTFSMFPFQPDTGNHGTTLWNVWKWTNFDPPSGGLYGGSTVTIHAGMRPFSANNDYENEIPLTPAIIYDDFTGVANRGTYLVGYSGSHDSGTSEEFLQMYWFQVIGPNVDKKIVALGNIDDVAGFNASTPSAPQDGSTEVLLTGQREVDSAAFRNFELWTAFTVDPPSGPDADQAAAHWIQINAVSTTPISDSFNPTVGAQDNVGDELVTTDAFTFYPSLAISDSGGVGLGFGLSSPDLFPSSFFQRLDGGCSVQEAPQSLRLGLDSYERPGGIWGQYSSTSFDPSATDCFWTFNLHAISREDPPNPGDDGRWGTSHGRFCPVTGVFCDGFNSGNTTYWSLVDP